MSSRYCALLLLTLAAVLGQPSLARSAPLPPFTVTSASGEVVASTALALDGPWLLVYVTPADETSERLLALVARSRIAADASRLAIVIAPGADDIARTQARWPDLATARWYRDDGRQALAALELAGTPAVMAMRQGDEAWRLLGVSFGTAELRAALESWLLL